VIRHPVGQIHHWAFLGRSHDGLHRRIEHRSLPTRCLALTPTVSVFKAFVFMIALRYTSILSLRPP
jgi:hypothetical protein